VTKSAQATAAAATTDPSAIHRTPLAGGGGTELDGRSGDVGAEGRVDNATASPIGPGVCASAHANSGISPAGVQHSIPSRQTRIHG